MRDVSSVLLVLTRHFFRRFFDSDTIRVEGETMTTVVRAVVVAAVPGLMTAFFLENQYPQRAAWGAIEDQYFFVLYSFAAMGAVAIFQWEMLFPDRLDFLVLSPLSIKAWQLLTAKILALMGFFGLFLFGSNVFGSWVLPAVTSGDFAFPDRFVAGELVLPVSTFGAFFQQVYAHVVAVTLAGTFAAAFFLALSGILLCILNTALFRLISPFVQMFSVALLILLFLYYGKVGHALPLLLTTPVGWARWVPPLWFLGVYEDLLHGASGPGMAHQMALDGYRATGMALAAAVLTYPIAWVRMRRLAVEGISSGLGQQAWWMRRLIRAGGRRPAEIAILAFICQTLTRTNRYQVYLAMYGGVGLSLATFCAVSFSFHGDKFLPLVSEGGLHAMLPLLLFWLIAGLRIAFALPLNLSAGWIFRITGVSVRECADAGRRWVFLCSCAVLLLVMFVLTMGGWGFKLLLVQTVVGFCLCILLTRGFFLGEPSVPFNKARMPGKTNLPLLLTLYLGFFPLFVFGAIGLEMNMEKHLGRLLLVSGIALGFDRLVRKIEDRPEEIEEEMEGYEGEFQLLGLS
jgi:hypothetical protein